MCGERPDAVSPVNDTALAEERVAMSRSGNTPLQFSLNSDGWSAVFMISVYLVIPLGMLGCQLFTVAWVITPFIIWFVCCLIFMTGVEFPLMVAKGRHWHFYSAIGALRRKPFKSIEPGRIPADTLNAICVISESPMGLELLEVDRQAEPLGAYQKDPFQWLRFCRVSVLEELIEEHKKRLVSRTQPTFYRE